jgi:hypothetical protein
VVPDGRYGEPGHRRQRFRCYPAGTPGGAFHRFTEVLPRQMTVAGDQFGRRPTDPKHKLGNPTTTSVLEPKLNRIKGWVAPRTHALRNRERLDRLLMLKQLQLNAQASEPAYARAIRDWLLAHDGRPIVRRRAVADPVDEPSLYSEAANRELGLLS